MLLRYPDHKQQLVFLWATFALNECQSCNVSYSFTIRFLYFTKAAKCFHVHTTPTRNGQNFSHAHLRPH